jgi:uncharacterized protein YqiB (DUF1249 family)
MQRPACAIAPLCLVPGRPTLGDLMTLCEENFALLGRLAPGLRHCRGLLVSRRQGDVDLHLRVEEQSPYTSLVRLTYVFADLAPPGLGPRRGADPDALLRVYHDARQVEVLELRQTALPRHVEYRHPALDSKWRLNLFLSKWLAYCLVQGHRFAAGGPEIPLPEGDDLIFSCS